jgi:hypothetical protein
VHSSLRKIAIIAATVVSVLALGSPANAEAYKTSAACGPSATYHNTVSLGAFAGHNVEVSERMCTNGTFTKWATQPNISFPSRFSPAAPLESVSVQQQPFIYSTKTCAGGPCRITWRFTVKQGIKGLPVQEFVFYYRVYPAYSQVCIGGDITDSACNNKSWSNG